jgi:multidrug efflux pump
MAMFASGEQFPDVRGRVTRLEFGPPVGFPVQFRVVGPDTAAGARDRLPRARHGAPEPAGARHAARLERAGAAIRVQIDQDKARLLGLTSADIQAR